LLEEIAHDGLPGGLPLLWIMTGTRRALEPSDAARLPGAKRVGAQHQQDLAEITEGAEVSRLAGAGMLDFRSPARKRHDVDTV